MEGALMDFLSAVAVLGASFLLEGAKKYTGILDGKIGSFIKPAQPMLIAAAGIGLPYLSQALGIGDIDPSLFVTAPTATVLTVSAREGLRRIQGKK